MKFDRHMLSNALIHEVLVQDCYKVRRLFNAPITTVVDVGANYGIFSILSRFYWPTAKIHAVEPHEATYSGLQENIAHLGVSHYQAALGDGTPVVMQRLGATSGTTVARPAEHDGIRSYRLPELFALLGVKPGPGVFLKIDVEGAERFLQHHQATQELLGLLGGFGMEIHAQTSKWPTSPTKMEWLQWLNDQRSPLRLAGMDVDIEFGTNIGYFCGRRIP